jgi:hypothetical protein
MSVRIDYLHEASFRVGICNGYNKHLESLSMPIFSGHAVAFLALGPAIKRKPALTGKFILC